MSTRNLLDRSLFLAGGISLIGLCHNTAAQTVIITPNNNIDETVVTGTLLQKPALSSSVPKDANGRPFADTGDYLRNISGVTSGRISGHGLEPVIRGQSRNQLNIINNGAFLEGAGPNRMDTPASFVDINTADSVIVHRGYQSVQHGPGGSGGTVIVEHRAPTFKEGQNLKGSLYGSFESNGNIWGTSGHISARADKIYFRLNGHYKDAENYQDGHKNTVKSAFTVYGGSAEIGYRDAYNLINFNISHVETRDILFPGTGMDSPEGSATIMRGKLHHVFDGSGVMQALKMEIYRAHAFHSMDNFTLRDRMMMFRQADLDAITIGGKIAADLKIIETDFTLGLDIKNTAHEGQRHGHNNDRTNMTPLQSILIPDATIQNIGFFAEALMPLADNLQVKAGLRYDNVKSSADNADMTNDLVMMGMMPMSPNMLYGQYYGISATPQTDNNLGGLLRLEYDVTAEATFYIGVSRSTRSASTVERYMASLMGDMIMPSGMRVNMSWIGNPALTPEKHHQLDMGFGIQKSRWHILFSAYYNHVTDYIFRDRAHGQDGILLNNNALVYRNIDARIWGFELEGKANITDKLALSGNISYTNGHNLDLDIPLYQIPPLSYDIELSYARDNWTMGSHLRGALKQPRIDDNVITGSGRDAGVTAGYAVVDLFASVTLMEQTKLRFGISNLFNKFYANHLNRESLNDAASVRVNEPGQTFYIRLQSEF